MKKSVFIMALSLSVAILSGIAGCADKENSESNLKSTSATDNYNESSDSTTESTEGTSPESKLSEEEQTLISKLKQQNFLGPDGETVKAEDAGYVFDTYSDFIEDGSSGSKFKTVMYDDVAFDENGEMIEPELISTVLRYDFAYIRYCRPLFYAGEVLNESEREELINSIDDVKWFKVKAGDKLDCGLTVKKALYEHFPVIYGNPTRDNYIEFDGEITLEGVLYTAQSTQDYLTQPGDLIFVPDPTKTSGLPISSITFEDYACIFYGMFSSPDSSIEYVMSDAGYLGWIVGKADDLDNKISIFGNDEYAHVRATLTNIKFSGDVNIDMPTMSAEIVDIERMD